MKYLYLMRHGETLFNVWGKVQGWCDSPLTENGMNQAKEVKERIKDIEFDHYYCSTSERACDTLEIITDKPYVRTKGLKERFQGLLEGESERVRPTNRDEFPHFLEQLGGESNEVVVKRVTDTLKQIMDKDDHQIVLAVSHAGACMNFLGSILKDKTAFEVLGGRLPNCGILKFSYDGDFHFEELIK